jgi:hypothetical protein
VNQVVGAVLLVVWLAVAVTAAYALVHAALQRPDAYTATNKMTKNAWLAILGGAVLLVLVTNVLGLGILGTAITACAAGVYLVDVRPKLLEIQGKSR